MDYELTPGYHPYGYEGVPGTCHWCGRKLRRGTYLDPMLQHQYSPTEWQKALRPLPCLGNYGDGHFCGLRCGYAYGLSAANQELPKER